MDFAEKRLAGHELRHHWRIARMGVGVGNGFWVRLRQRKLVQWALAYVAAAFAFIQGLDVVAQRFGWPDQVEKLIILVLAVGFFVALVLAWYHGERGAQKIGGVELLIIALLLAIGGGALWAYARMPAAAPAMAAGSPDGAQGNPEKTTPDSATAAAASAPRIPATAQTIPAKSVAVLPFANEGGKQDEQFFSDGLSDDLINALSQFDGLKVISRNSAFQFRNSKATSAEIGRLLGVAHLLEGSVQRAQDEVRITATLVNASDGSVLWSRRYDKPYKDLFALQDAITQSVAGTLKAKLLTAPGAVVQSDRPPSGNLDAYTAYQRGVALGATGTEAGIHEAIEAYTEATRLDPHYAAAYAKLTTNWMALAITYAGAGAKQAFAKARAASRTALALDPDSAAAHLARGTLLQNVDMDWRGAEVEAQRALQLEPNGALTQGFVGTVKATLGDNGRALELARLCIAADPRSADAYFALTTYLIALGRLDEARQAIEKTIDLQSQGAANFTQLAIIDILDGDAKAALAAAKREPPGPWHDIAMALALQVGSDQAAADSALDTLVTRRADTAPYQIAETYALRQDPDAMFKWLEHAWTVRDPGVGTLLSDPFILRYKNDPRFAAFCGKVGLPTTTDAVAMKP
jgi:TolB-like protein